MRLFFLIVISIIVFNSCINRHVDTEKFFMKEYIIEDNNQGLVDSLIDSRDGKIYKTISIGNQIWMSENLAYTPTEGKYWSYNDTIHKSAFYGYLYDWETATKVCPCGWHLPSDSEWKRLTDYLGGNQTAGRKLKEAGNTYWNDPSTNFKASNESGFTAISGGCRDHNGNFFGIKKVGSWWSSTEDSTEYAWARLMSYSNSIVYTTHNKKSWGFSVRCVKD